MGKRQTGALPWFSFHSTPSRVALLQRRTTVTGALITLTVLSAALFLFYIMYGSATSSASEYLATAGIDEPTMYTEIPVGSRDSPVAVAIATDGEQDAGLLNLVMSLNRHRHGDRYYVVYIIVSPQDSEFQAHIERLRAHLHCAGFSESDWTEPGVRIQFVRYNHHLSQETIRVTSERDIQHGLQSPANFARFHLTELLPHLDKVVWLDCDTLITTDIAHLFSVPLSDEMLLAAVPRTSNEPVFSARVAEIFRERYGRELVTQYRSYNAGVFVAHLRAWRLHNTAAEFQFWMHRHAQEGLWSLGSQPILVIATDDRWVALDLRWNLDRLGYVHGLGHLLERKGVLHWTGGRKPWMPTAIPAYAEMWRSYLPAIPCRIR